MTRQSVTEKMNAGTGGVGQINQTLLLDIESNSNVERVADKVCHITASSEHKAEVIDLLSPSPQMRPPCLNVSKCQGANVPSVDVIDLSDSENEASPEHTRKARELRLFLTNIRENS